jgi:small subunit ribosomal protein S8
MSMTDPIADMLARIRNGIMSRKARVEIPASRLKQRIAEILKQEGFIHDFRRVDGPKTHPALQIELKWMIDNSNAIEGLRRVSRPGQRRYVGKAEIPSVRGGQGIAILTTSKGVMTDRIARQQSVGGEVLCEVW